MHTFQVERYFADRTGSVQATMTVTCPNLVVAMHVLARLRAHIRQVDDGTLAGLLVNGSAVPVDGDSVRTDALARAFARGPRP